MADKALKTSVFVWEGTDKKGTKVKGELSSQNPTLVKAQLRKQGITPVKVRKKGISLLGAGKKIKPMDIALFTRQMSTMMAAGVPLVEALDSVSGATGNVVFRDAVGKIKQDVSTGMQLNFSMRTTNIFPSMAIQMTAIGEESGALDDMLAKVAGFYEQEVDNAVDNLTALMEPMIMAVLGVLVGGLIIAMYLPIFQLGNVV
ncbi:TPA: type II secretion system F family protein [Pseudomonas aeruginosa]|nr:type II secretion system F family protein [Pseudomonas aeruginosa]HCI2545081.1 type II secretion system F family protein [Pseudomonas aeruginosa]